MKKSYALFDLDGVIADTEPQYDIYWERVAQQYGLASDFHKTIKGTPLTAIMSNYFGHLTQEQRDDIVQGCDDYEAQMQMLAMPGTLEFMQRLKDAGIKMGLVTSSGEAKVERVIKEFGLDRFLSTIVTPKRITRGKPDPMCYELGAKDLGATPNECVVFEDALTGIAAGKGAGMKVVALSTTFPREKLEIVADLVLDSLADCTAEEFMNW